MSQEIDTALVNGYQSNIEIQFQQMQARLRRTVTVESQNSEYEYYDRIGPVTAYEIGSRHGDTQYVDTPHSRRRNQTKPAVFADLIDKRDKLRMLADPTGSYVRNAVMALNRNFDTKVIAAAEGSAFAGKNGETEVSFDATNQEIAEDYVESGATADSNITLGKLRRARFLFDSNEAVMDGEELFCIWTASQVQALLRNTETTSSDFNTVKALVNGEINQFLGFTFVRTELLNKTGDDRHVLLYPQSAITMGMAEDVFTSVDRLPGKNYSVQVYASQDTGGVRMWEEKVIRMLCDETV